MTKLQAIRDFCSFVCEDKVTIAKDRYPFNNWGMNIGEKHPRLKLPKHIPCDIEEVDKIFRKDFVNRCKMAQGFSHVTLTLLHECGHWATRSVINIAEYCRLRAKVNSEEEYLAIPWERLATEWAICWLNSPANRKVAKQFEKNYFNY